MARKAISNDAGTGGTPEKRGKPPRGWQSRFTASLAETGHVTASCRAAKVSRRTVYRERDRSAEFRAAWDEAFEDGIDALEMEARRRAVQGTEKPVFYQGAKVGTTREYSDTLLIFLLKGARPEKYRDSFDLHRIAEAIESSRLAAEQPAPGGKPPRRRTAGGSPDEAG